VSNGVFLPDLKTIEEEINYINVRTVLYLGGSHAFVDNIYTIHEKKGHYSSILPISELNNIYNFDVQSKKDVAHSIKGLSNLYINLGY